jgi:serine/threonine-protein kinase
MILGTAAYMSPEQAKGRETDRRTDIWAFGCVLFEMLTGRAAFEGDDVSEILASVIKGTATLDQLPASVPPAIRRLLRRCLQKDTRQRFQDIGDVRYELEHVESEPAAPVAEAAPAVAPSSRLSWLPWLAGIGLAVVVGLAVWVLRPVPEPGSVMRFDYDLPADRALTADSRVVIAVSPDGSGFVYVTPEGLEFRPMGSLGSRPIAGTAGAIAPFFSPDGAWVGFWTGGRLVKVPVAGGTPVPISVASNALLGTSWGADGTIWSAHADGIRRVSENGGDSELVIASEGVRFADPQLLPGGDWVLFTAGRPGTWDAAQIVAQSLGTGERKVLWEGGRAARYVETGHLVYAQGNSLFALLMDLESMTVSGGPVPLVEGVQGTVGSGHGANFGVSRRGTLVYLEDTGAAEASRTLALVDRSGRTTILDVPLKSYLSPRLSPDGRRVAVQTDEVDGGSQIWTYDLSGATAMQRLTIDGNNSRPLWTPDGQRIAFASDRDGTTCIYWQAADGSGRAERLTTAPEGTYHFPDAWSGTTLIFRQESNDGGAPNNVANQMDIWMVSLDGGTPGEPQVFRAAPPTQFMGGAVSPDGRWMAYASGLSADLQYQIYVEPFPATGERRLVSRELGIMPLWSRNGRELFYRTINQTGTAPQTLKKINVSTDPSFTFTSEEAVPIGRFMEFGYYRSFDVTPDGERFLVVLPPEQSELAPVEPRVDIVVNWFEELKRLAPAD